MTFALDVEQINAAASRIIGNLKEESLAAYCFLHEQWGQGSAVDNKLFQFVFRSFYRLDNAGLTDTFKERYFELLEASRVDGPDIETICTELYAIKNRKGQASLQFSFVTKLANMVNSELPIYDSEVAKMYGYKAPASSKPLNERMTHLLQFYDCLAADYQKILADGSLNESITHFDSTFARYTPLLSPSKKLDFIVWSAGKLAGK